MQNKFYNKKVFVPVALLLSICIVLFVWFKMTYNNYFTIVKTIKLTNQNNLVFIDEYDTSNIYFLSNKEIKLFKSDASFNPIIKVNKISWRDINLEVKEDFLIIHIKKSAYMHGKIVHFQNYIVMDGLRQYKIILQIKE